MCLSVVRCTTAGSHKDMKAEAQSDGNEGFVVDHAVNKLLIFQTYIKCL